MSQDQSLQTLYSSSRNHSTTSASPPPPTTNLKRLLALVGLGASVGLATYFYAHSDQSTVNISSPPPAYCQEKPPGSSARGFNFIAEAVENAAPSVVYLEISRHVSVFFGSLDAVATMAGSGFVVEDGRHVLTNAHVVSNAHSVDIKLNTGEVVKGEVTDMDEVADLAIIRMDLPPGMSPPPPLKFGNSNNLRPGEWVVAMGSPLALTNTITCGIVSCLHRPSKDLGVDRDMQYIQTDAAITIGNSGGPLVNLDGDVIGVNTMTAGPGISFAIPSTVAQNFVRNANKKVTGKYAAHKKYTIGVSMLTLSPRMMSSIQQYFSIPKEVRGGVLLTRVWANSPAHVAGLKRGDVVVHINGKKIESNLDMHEMVRSGEKLSIEFYRKLQYMTCTVVPESI